MASGGSKFLDLDNNDKAAAWMIGFAAQAEIDNVTGDAPLKRLFLAKCGVDAISRLQSLLFPLNVDDDACTFDSIKAAVRCITHPTDKFLVAERMTLLTMEQHVGEHPRDFMVRINNQAALCDLTKLAANPVQEITKLVYLAGLSDSDLKLRLLEHLQSNENASVMDLVSLASIASSQRSFAHKEALPGPSPAFHAAPQRTPGVSVHPSFLRASPQLQSPALCTNCGLNHGRRDCFAKHKTCFHCGKIGHFRKFCRSAPKRQIAQINDQGDSHTDTNVHTSADVQCLHSSLDIAATASKLVECKVNSNTVSMQLDSGAACSIIPHCTAKSL